MKGFAWLSYFGTAIFLGFVTAVGVDAIFDNDVGLGFAWTIVCVIVWGAIDYFMGGRLFNIKAVPQTLIVPQQHAAPGGMGSVVPQEAAIHIPQENPLITAIAAYMERTQVSEFNLRARNLRQLINALLLTREGVIEEFEGKEDSCDIILQEVEDAINHIMETATEFIRRLGFFNVEDNRSLRDSALEQDDEEGARQYEAIETSYLTAFSSLVKVVREADIHMKRLLKSQGEYSSTDSTLYLESLEQSLSNVRMGIW
jgi:hypothetical protein